MAKSKPPVTRNPRKPAAASTYRKTWIYGLVTVLMLITGLFITYVITVWKAQKAEERAEEAIYSAFGIAIPTNYSIHGIDVSSHQNTIAWPLVNTMRINNISMGFVFIKATEGLNDIDKNFAKNYKNAKKAGMVCGAYHFFLSTKSGASQAANYIKNVPLSKGDLPPVVDIEELYGVPPALMQQRLKECLSMLEQFYRVKPIVYSYVDFYEHYLGNSFNNYPLWIAHYEEPEKPRIGRDWLFWQHNEAGHVNGITTPVDCNVFNGDSTAFKDLLLR
ncbi:glycoside hydrolase family 25 protein [Parasediminibacterium sp. JCM 36343]|uniref:glycoside hydrolase family 25 protein n=1 Tax=Parasediminibacterium sp. JCM 36343 TaxID=3374279 RepID=UPI003979929D